MAKTPDTVEKQELPGDLFERLDSGLQAMFTGAVNAYPNSSSKAKTRDSAANVARALIELHSTFKPTGQ